MDSKAAEMRDRAKRRAPVARRSSLPLTTMVLAMLASPAQAETTAETARQWGLIGPWSLDCALPPDHDRGTVLAYAVTDSGTVVHHRDFGDSSDEAEVLSATLSTDGVLNLRVYFPAMKQIREYGMKRLADGSIRAIYNRDEQNRYSIRDGKFVANGKPTPVQHKCER